MINHIALVSETADVPTWQVMVVAAALDKQVRRDFGPVWGIDATVNAFDILEDVPTGYWPVIVMDDIGFDAAGIHLDENKQPFGLVQNTNTWTLTASHEVLEMLADPLGNTLRAGWSIHPDQGRVEYLVEVCDPSEALAFGYSVNGIPVSDFYTPDFFLPVPSQNVRYSFTGAIGQPRSILQGGYISWLNPPTNEWWQQIWFTGNQPQFRNLGVFTDAEGQSYRTQIDQATKRYRLEDEEDRPTSVYGLPPDDDRIVQKEAKLSSYNQSTKAQAGQLRRSIERVRKLPKASRPKPTK